MIMEGGSVLGKRKRKVRKFLELDFGAASAFYDNCAVPTEEDFLDGDYFDADTQDAELSELLTLPSPEGDDRDFQLRSTQPYSDAITTPVFTPQSRERTFKLEYRSTDYAEQNQAKTYVVEAVKDRLLSEEQSADLNIRTLQSLICSTIKISIHGPLRQYQDTSYYMLPCANVMFNTPAVRLPLKLDTVLSAVQCPVKVSYRGKKTQVCMGFIFSLDRDHEGRYRVCFSSKTGLVIDLVTAEHMELLPLLPSDYETVVHLARKFSDIDLLPRSRSDFLLRSR